MRAANRQGDAEAINDIVADELGSDDEPAQPPESSSSSDEAASSDEERAPPPIMHRCVLCGRMSSSVNLQLPTGRWANLPMEQRLFCDSCEAAE